MKRNDRAYLRIVKKMGLLSFVLLACLPFIYPFWWMTVNSLNTAAGIFGLPSLLPSSWLWSNYIEVFVHQPFALHYLNSIVVAVAGTAGNIIVASLSGYAFARIRFPGRTAAFILLLTALMMPVEITIVPLFFQMNDFGLTDTLFPLILLAVFGAQGAFSSFMMRQYFITFPRELEEAAAIDGLSTARTFFRIIAPLAWPVIGSASILCFLFSWNLFLEPLVFIDSLNNFTLPLSLANFSDTYGLPRWNIQLAATTLSVLPVFLVYALFQSKIRSAMVSSGLKE
ncbi:MAG: carbohydrate ABC transporter permease [Spirochaetales bacterium]|nr:carbohydrate ABC transporter permease [Spirochaetales bacterium]